MGVKKERKKKMKTNNNFKKKTVALGLVLVLVLASFSTVFAANSEPQAENSTSQKITENELRQQLESMGYDVQYVKKVNTADTEKVASNTLNFDTIEQFSQFDKELFAEPINAPAKETTSTENAAPRAQALTVSGTGNASAWAPYANGTLFCWKNVDFNFKASWYTLAGYYTITSISSPSSYVSGLNVAVTWTQTAISSSKDSTGLHAKFNVKGYFTFGIKIGEFEVGMTKSDSWSLTSDDINDFID